MTTKTKITIIGGGVGGYPAAIQAARMGAEVTLIEKDLLGGVCLNRGCIPTKSLLQTGNVINTIQHAETFGVKCSGYSVNFSSVMNRKNAVIKQLRDGVQKLLAAKKIKVIKGTASFSDSSTVEIPETKEKIKSDKIIIATGSKPVHLKIEGAGGPRVLDSDGFLEMESLPQSAVIVGGGVIGVEFAQILNAMGVKVTILEMVDHLLPGTDREIAVALEKKIIEEGISVFTSAGVTKITHGKKTEHVAFTYRGKTQKCLAEKVIFSVGRKPHLEGLGADKIGLAVKDNKLTVNEYMETNIPGIYAAGDVIGGIMLAHVATAEGECAVKNAMGQKTPMNHRVIPSCVYTSPEIGSVGLTEEQAKEMTDIEVGRFPLYACGKALVLDETYGMVKIVMEKKYREVLGVHILGPHATDMIAEAVLGMSMEMTIEELAHAVHPHPTLSEAIMESALSLCGGAIHMP